MYNILLAVGGVVLIIIGTSLMGESSSKFSGSATVIDKLSPVACMGLSTIITAIVQSSSGVTTAAALLAGSGAVSLGQAFAIVIGANIGTTSTAWLYAVADLQSSITVAISVAIGIAGLIMFAAGNEKVATAGKILIGLDVFINGAAQISNISSTFSLPELIQSNPLALIVSGTATTAVIQSSSAGIGVLQALSSSGEIPLQSAAYIVVGMNIGTCATALIATFFSKRTAKTVAYFHLIFNTVTGLAFCAIINIFHLNFAANPTNIAMVHTGCNLTGALIFAPIMVIKMFRRKLG